MYEGAEGYLTENGNLDLHTKSKMPPRKSIFPVLANLSFGGGVICGW